MIIRRREQLKQFREYVFQETEGGCGGGVQVFPYSPAGFNLIMAVRKAAQFRVCGNCGSAVTGDLDLRDHCDAAPAGIFHNLTDIVLGIETAVGLSVADATVPCGFLPPGADACEAGVFVYLDTPALIFREVPVEDVLLVHGH